MQSPPREGLAPTMVTSVGLCLAILGALGAVLAAWQIVAWLLFRDLPPLADEWARAGVTGTLFTVYFERLPLILLLAAAFHAFVGWLGLALFLRRPWARRGTIVFAFAWSSTAVLGWAAARYALADLRRGYPEHVGFAASAEALAAQLVLLNVGLAAGLVLLMIQPSVRAQFGR